MEQQEVQVQVLAGLQGDVRDHRQTYLLYAECFVILVKEMRQNMIS